MFLVDQQKVAMYEVNSFLCIDEVFSGFAILKYIQRPLAIYASKDRARDVFLEITEAIRKGESLYYLPEE